MAIFICIISGIFWSLFDVSRKLTLGKISSISLLIIFSIAQILIFFIWVILDGFKIDIFSYFIPGVSLIIISTISALLFLESIKKSELSLTIPLLSFTPLFSALLSSFMLKENLVITQYFGIIFIFFGAIILYSKKISLTEIYNSIFSILKNKSAKYMLCVSFLWSLTPIIDKICFKFSSINLHGLIQAIGIFLILFCFYKHSIQKDFSTIKANKLLILITVLIGTIATVLQFFAIKLTFVSIMESIKRSFGQILSIVFGSIFFKESISHQKILGIFIIITGVLNLLLYS
tara:strand:+ start:939 stop:1808 length:870 start_codon:yes stop_codon:yes gene_type:complete